MLCCTFVPIDGGLRHAPGCYQLLLVLSGIPVDEFSWSRRELEGLATGEVGVLIDDDASVDEKYEIYAGYFSEENF